MAINSYEICDKISLKSPNAPNAKGGKISPTNLIAMDYGSNDIIVNTSKRQKKKIQDSKSPYLAGDRVQMLSRVTERRLVAHRKPPEFVSSFPLAANIYKASSDEFNAFKHNNRKVRKSVLTIPNEPSRMPHICTVSDMNDSEYYYQDEDKPKLKYKKRLPVLNRKSRPRNKDFEFYDRDARHCSQMNIDLDCSSTDMIDHFKGDEKRDSNKFYSSKNYTTENIDSHDVWRVLRNINRFQFRPTPHISEESVMSPKKKKKGFVRKRINRKNRRNSSIIETCTEEIAYLAKFEVDSKSPTSASQSSSYDRITVIDKKDTFDDMHQERNKTFTLPNHLFKAVEGPKPMNQPNEKGLNKSATRNNVKAVIPLNKNNRTGYNKMNKFLKKNYQGKLKDSSGSSLNKDSLVSSNYNRNLRHPESNEKLTNDVKFQENTKIVNNTLNKTDNQRLLSGDSGSSKNYMKKYSKEKLFRPSSEESNQLSRGMTKVVLSNNQEAVLPNRVDTQTKKPRLVTTMPSAAIMPKLTTADIKRRLAHIKFPLVILGKDQVSSTIEVIDYNPPQFYGLDEHIWPFMVEWTQKLHPRGKANLPQNRRNMWSLHSTNNLRKVNNEITLNKPSKDKKNINNENVVAKKKVELKRISDPVEFNNAMPQSAKKTKPLQQFKDKMLKLLFKKSSDQHLNNINGKVYRPTEPKDLKVANEPKPMRKEQTDASTETVEKLTAPRDQPNLRKANPIPPPNKINVCTSNVDDKQATKYPWARAKWASDFIESVIKKMKDGAYYSHEHEEERYVNTCVGTRTTRNTIDFGFIDKVINKLKNSACIDFKEIAILTPNTLGDKFKEDSQCSDLIPEKDNDFVMNIPGFDETLPALKIETLNMNEISIKHCLTNVMVQFDVTVPEDPDHLLINVKKSSSCIPISKIDSRTKIFKCQTTIFNAVLPAELCSVLPKIMRNFLDSKLNYHIGIPKLPLNNAESLLSTISEDKISSLTASGPMLSLPIYISPILRKLQQGMFSGKHLAKPISRKALVDMTISFETYKRSSEIIKKVSNLFYQNVKLMFTSNADPYSMSMSTVFVPIHSFLYQGNDQKVSEITPKNTCTAVQMYTGKNSSSMNAFGSFDFTQMMRKDLKIRICSISFNTHSYFNGIEPKRENVITVNLGLENSQGINKHMSITISKLKIDSLFTGVTKRYGDKHIKGDKSPLKAIVSSNDDTHNKGAKRIFNCPGSVGNKLRRKGFVRLYKKCKSTSNISGEGLSTALSKIVNLDDFFQALGSGKLLSSVFDGVTGQKILKSIFQMKNWINDITPRQAMLVLLLTNKKDTPNLMRFRPVLLQGIAVKRITRATELDMEIEVIERERLNKLPQSEGISYLPASLENHDSLLEELTWIAKTTASDYQKPFDENSERLLKSLLEKRKKLNPSYLRVMARYVGLGLLKAPIKHQPMF